MNFSTVIGIFLGIVAIFGGNILEGGKSSSILQPTAAVIVFGGTLGATMLSYPLKDILGAVAALKEVFGEDRIDPEYYINEILKCSTITRKHGVMALEAEIQSIEDPFFKKALNLAVDGIPSDMLKDIMYQENAVYTEQKRRIAKVFETAGGFAPTIGIIGAVLGLIHVMENLAEPSKLGAGIAVAFVSTIYGVGSANILLLPVSKKILNKLEEEISLREMIIKGILAIQAGKNPYYIEQLLRTHVRS